MIYVTFKVTWPLVSFRPNMDLLKYKVLNLCPLITWLDSPAVSYCLKFSVETVETSSNNYCVLCWCWIPQGIFSPSCLLGPGCVCVCVRVCLCVCVREGMLVCVLLATFTVCQYISLVSGICYSNIKCLWIKNKEIEKYIILCYSLDMVPNLLKHLLFLRWQHQPSRLRWRRKESGLPSREIRKPSPSPVFLAALEFPQL